MTEQKKRFNYTWVIVFLCALVMFLSGFVGGYQGQWLSAVTEGLGLSRTAFSMSNSFRFASSAILNMVFIVVLRRFGMRKTFALGFSFMILAMLTYSISQKVWHFYVAGILFGTGIAFACSAITSILLKQWVTKGLGTIMGLTAACTGLGAAVGVRVMTPILFQEDNPLGFRDAYRLCALVLLISAVVIVVLVRENRDVTNKFLEKKNHEKTKTEISSKGFLFFVVICVFFCNALLMGINSVYSAHMRDVGLPTDVITWATSTLSIMLILSKTLTGAIFDKFGLRLVLLLCQTATLIGFGLMVIMDATSTTAAIIFAMVFPFALPLETIVVPLIVEELFDRSEYTNVLSYTTAVSNIGFAVGPPVVNKVYDLTNSYLPAIYVCMGLMVVIMIAFQIVITVAHKKGKTKRSVV